MASFAPNPLIAIFQAKSICVLGTVDEPLFKVADVARYIQDVNYKRSLTQYDNTLVIKQQISYQNSDLGATMSFFTEKGLYRYLIRSSRPAADAFQNFVFDTLISVRKSIIAGALLEAKIARSRLMAGPSNFRETFDSKAVRAHHDRIRLGVLYFIRAGVFVKIGWTLHLPTRLRKLQTGNPEQLRVVATFLCVHPYKYEKLAQLYFAESHRAGEWFELSDAEVHVYVNQLRDESALN